MKLITKVFALALVFGSLTKSTYANSSSSEVIAESYVIRVQVEEFKKKSGVFVASYLVEDMESKDKDDVAAMQLLISVFFPNGSNSFTTLATGITTVVTDPHVAVKRYHLDGCVTYVRY